MPPLFGQYPSGYANRQGSDRRKRNTTAAAAAATRRLVVEHTLSSDSVMRNGVSFSAGRSITFSCTYDMADQTLESDVFGVTSDAVEYDGT